jgi:hypothetical protein
MPPDGDAFAVAPGVEGQGFRTFHVVELPQPVAVLMVDAKAPLEADERATIEALLAGQVDHVAFLSRERTGAGVVEGHGPPAILATAAAALKAIGGWDESFPISIEVNGTKIDVRLSCNLPARR